MNHDQVTELLKNYRSYEYAAMNCGNPVGDALSFVFAERMQRPGTWDRTRYNRIVYMIKGAVDHVLSDDQRTVIMRKYLERNTSTLGEIADAIHKDRSTVSRWHTEAIRRLSVALIPLEDKETEITNFDHMFEKGWVFKEPA